MSTWVLEGAGQLFTGYLLFHRKILVMSMALCPKLGGFSALEMRSSWKVAISHLLANAGLLNKKTM